MFIPKEAQEFLENLDTRKELLDSMDKIFVEDKNLQKAYKENTAFAHTINLMRTIIEKDKYINFEEIIQVIYTLCDVLEGQKKVIAELRIQNILNKNPSGDKPM